MTYYSLVNTVGQSKFQQQVFSIQYKLNKKTYSSIATTDISKVRAQKTSVLETLPCYRHQAQDCNKENQRELHLKRLKEDINVEFIQIKNELNPQATVSPLFSAVRLEVVTNIIPVPSLLFSYPDPTLLLA